MAESGDIVKEAMFFDKTTKKHDGCRKPVKSDGMKDHTKEKKIPEQPVAPASPMERRQGRDEPQYQG